MSQFLAVETSDWFLLGFLWGGSFVHNGRTFAQDLVGRSGILVVYSHGRDFLVRLPVFDGFDPFGLKDGVRLEIVGDLIFPEFLSVV
jgi:hypothetical protein